MPRQSKQIQPNKSYRVVCVGHTEYNYLDIYKRENRLHYNVKITIKPVRPEQQLAYAKKVCKGYDSCFVLFDYDSFFESSVEAKRIIEDFEKNKNHFVVFSNECFDLWILAHYIKISITFMNRKEIYRKLGKILSMDYETLKADTELIKKLVLKIDDAIKNISSISNHRYENPTFDLDNFKKIISK